jgi:hypothetical protein
VFASGPLRARNPNSARDNDEVNWGRARTGLDILGHSEMSDASPKPDIRVFQFESKYSKVGHRSLWYTLIGRGRTAKRSGVRDKPLCYNVIRRTKDFNKMRPLLECGKSQFGSGGRNPLLKKSDRAVFSSSTLAATVFVMDGGRPAKPPCHSLANQLRRQLPTFDLFRRGMRGQGREIHTLIRPELHYPPPGVVDGFDIDLAGANLPEPQPFMILAWMAPPGISTVSPRFTARVITSKTAFTALSARRTLSPLAINCRISPRCPFVECSPPGRRPVP